MSSKEITVHDHLAFGKVIKSWAANPKTIPERAGDFRKTVPAAVAEIGAGFADDHVLQIFRPRPDTVSLIIPYEEDLKPLVAGQSYPLPLFYDEVFDKKRPRIPDNKKEDFRSRRIADYAMRKCI